MHIAVSGQHLGRCREIEPAVFAPDGQQFGTTGKKLRRPTFVRLDVGALMTKDTLERPAELREAEAIEDLFAYADTLPHRLDVLVNSAASMSRTPGGGLLRAPRE